MRSYVLGWLERYVGGAANVLAPSWFTCIGFAGLATLVLMVVLAKRRGIDPATAATAVLWGYVAAVLAGIGVPMLIDAVERAISTGRFQLRWSGMTSFWGYLAAAGAVAYVCKRERLSLARFGDLATIPLGVALVFSRIGCFLGGCDYGKVSSLPWAVRFPAGSPAWRDHVRSGLLPADRAASLPVHPTQLYEALIGVAIVVIAAVLARRAMRPGRLFLVVAATYALGRLVVVEPLRGDAGRGIYAGLSSGQIFSVLVLLAIGAGVLLTRRAATAVATSAALALLVANPLDADAQVFGPEAGPLVPDGPPGEGQAAPVQPDPQPRPPQLDVPQHVDPENLPYAVDELPPRVLGPHERPLFSTGLLLGVAKPVSREQVGTLTGTSLSLGYLPGRFGMWLDFDSYSNNEAKHSTVMGFVSYSQRVTRQLTIGGRTGLGLGLVNFVDPAFSDVAAKTFRGELIAELAIVRHWALWVRPVAIDVISAPELGGAITTYQFRIGAAYRFGSRSNAVRPPQPPPPPPSMPTLVGLP
ncbi:MAG: prolipoprotein diacylglyceryl transferase [Deltaproteobacteria bacterium]|nr:prolipoprotein diacylglyceryl transferase [Deltaproteobacteria bacterium]